MQCHEINLPGGLTLDGKVERRVGFRPLTGRIEQSLVEARDLPDRPAYVTAALGEVVERIGETPAEPAVLDELCVADRQFLMLRLGALLNGEQLWLKVECGYCGSPFDVELRRDRLPVKKAGTGYPTVSLRLADDELEARVPTGADQESICGLSDEAALRRLMQRCILSVNGKSPKPRFAESLGPEEIGALDQALDEIAPAVCDRLLVTCPECDRGQQAEIDHYDHAGVNAIVFYHEIHTLASRYHWSEAEILSLPRGRRRRYLDMIERSAGFHGRG